MKAVLAIDQGTTGTTCLVLDEACRVVGRAYSEFTQFFPQPGWVEHDAAEIWATSLRVAQAAVQQGKLTDATIDVVALGITNQRETIVVWDRKTGVPVGRAIVWQDRRTAARCRALKDEGREEWVRERTGLVLDPYFSASKVEWLLDNTEGLRARAEAGDLALGTIDSWLVWNLTAGACHITDPTNASRTMLYNIDTLDWDDELLALFNVPRALLPDVRPSSEVYGATAPGLFDKPIAVAGIAGDQQAALFGQGCYAKGQGKNTYGTGAFLLLHTGDERVASKAGLLTTVACGPKGDPQYALEGAIFIAGAAVQWLRDGLGIIENAAETRDLARSVDSNDGVYFVPAFVGLGAPHWDANARGTIVGLTRGTQRAHLARAALEAMAYGTADVLRAMESDAGVVAKALTVDGGGSQNDWLMQFQTDMIQVPVQRPQMVETTALGAAGLAGIAVGVWTSVEDFIGSRPQPTVFEPSISPAERDELHRGWERAVKTTLHWADLGTS
ncbi:MAG: glycerol kinase GlpK [Longimicrobiales bacterium]